MLYIIVSVILYTTDYTILPYYPVTANDCNALERCRKGALRMAEAAMQHGREQEQDVGLENSIDLCMNVDLETL